MFQDEIAEEIHKIREEYSRSLNQDLNAIFADLQKATSGKRQRSYKLTYCLSLV